MIKTVLIIALAIIVSLLFPTAALAYSDIPVSGDWECEYEVNEYGVGASGGTATVSLRVTNTDPSDSITYVSVNWGAGSASEFYEVKSVSVAPGSSRVVSFSIPVEAEDAGIPNTLWVAMTTRGESNVDGIGAVTGVVFGPAPVYDASCEISTSTTTINRGNTVKIAFSGAKTGNKPVDIRVYDQTGYLIFSMDNMDILYLGSKEYVPQSTTTYQYTCKIYKPGTDTLMNETVSSPLTVTVIQPAAEPEPEPEPAAEEAAAETAEEATPEPVPETTAATEVIQETSDTDISINQERTIIVETQKENEKNSQFNSDTLMMILIVMLVMVFAGLASVLIYMIKNNKK
jgi:hypothetical protein